MESLASVDVKHIAGFLDFKDMVTLSQTRQAYQADLKPLIRKAEVARMKELENENGKLKKVVATLTRAYLHIANNVFDDYGRGHNVIHDWNLQIVTMVQRRYDHLEYFDLPDPIHHRNSREPPPLAYFDGSPAEDNAIIQDFLNEMD